jgi:hypothetical protein
MAQSRADSGQYELDRPSARYTTQLTAPSGAGKETVPKFDMPTLPWRPAAPAQFGKYLHE